MVWGALRGVKEIGLIFVDEENKFMAGKTFPGD